MFAKNAFRQNFIYRANTIIDMLTTMLYLLIQFNIWQALYHTQSVVETVSLQQMLTYCVIGELVLPFTSNSIAYTLGTKIRTGEIGGDFVRPINLKLYLFSDQLGNSLYMFCFRFIPAAVMTVIFGAFMLPQSVWHGMMFAVTLFLGITLQFLISYALGLIVFWIKKDTFVSWLMRALVNLFAGSVVPLWFYPDVLRNIALYLPFRYVTYEPIAIYLGQTSTSDFFFTVLMQLLWIAVVYLVGRVVWARAEKIVVVQGG